MSSKRHTKPSTRRTVSFMLWVPAALLGLGVIGLAAFFLTTSEETYDAPVHVAQAQPLPAPAAAPVKMEVASILFEPIRDTPQAEAAGEWSGAIVLRDGNTIPFRIQGVESDGFTAVAVRCLVGEECKIGADVDPKTVNEEEIQQVVDDLLAVARQMTTGSPPPSS